MSNTLKKPTLADAKNKWLKLPITTNESAYSIYSKEQDKYIDYLESQLKEITGQLSIYKSVADEYMEGGGYKKLQFQLKEVDKYIESITHDDWCQCDVCLGITENYKNQIE